MEIDPEQLWMPGKHPLTVKTRNLWCYWAVRKLSYSATDLSKIIVISQPSVSISVRRVEKLTKTQQSELVESYHLIGVCKHFNILVIKRRTK